MNSTTDIVFQILGTEGARLTTSGDFSISKTIKIGSTATACSLANEGAIRYNSVDKMMNFCDGTNWAEIVAVGTASADPTPNIFTYTDITNASLGVIILSENLTILGFNGPVLAEVSGTGTPQISINGGAWVTAGNINPADTLRVRLNSSVAVNTAFTAAVTVGTVTDNWTVTTKTGNTRIFITSGAYIGGAIGSLANADAYCQTDANAKGYGGVWTALMSDETTHAKDRVIITYPLVRADTGAVVDSVNVWDGSIEGQIGPSIIWSGTQADGTLWAGSTCNSWTNSTLVGRYGNGAFTSPSWIKYGGTPCSSAFPFYCVEQ